MYYPPLASYSGTKAPRVERKTVGKEGGGGGGKSSLMENIGDRFEPFFFTKTVFCLGVAFDHVVPPTSVLFWHQNPPRVAMKTIGKEAGWRRRKN